MEYRIVCENEVQDAEVFAFKAKPVTLSVSAPTTKGTFTAVNVWIKRS